MRTGPCREIKSLDEISIHLLITEYGLFWTHFLDYDRGAYIVVFVTFMYL